MDNLAVQFLIAAHELVNRAGPLIADLSSAHDVFPNELWHLWVARRCGQIGSFYGGEWTYFFHGYECDLEHVHDGRFLRIDFGPNGRIDTFSDWGITQFVMTSRSPWPDFGALKTYLADRPPPHDQYSGSWERAGVLWHHLEDAGLIEPADPDLMNYGAQHTSLNTDGIRSVRLPQGTPDHVYFDVAVSHRRVISEAGRQVLKERKFV